MNSAMMEQERRLTATYEHFGIADAERPVLRKTLLGLEQVNSTCDGRHWETDLRMKQLKRIFEYYRSVV